MPDRPASHLTTPRLRIDADRCTWRSLGEQVVVLDLEGSAYFELNHTAALLWPALIEGTDEPALMDILAAEGSLDAAADMRLFVEELGAAGLLENVRAQT